MLSDDFNGINEFCCCVLLVENISNSKGIFWALRLWLFLKGLGNKYLKYARILLFQKRMTDLGCFRNDLICWVTAKIAGTRHSFWVGSKSIVWNNLTIILTSQNFVRSLNRFLPILNPLPTAKSLQFPISHVLATRNHADDNQTNEVEAELLQCVYWLWRGISRIIFWILNKQVPVFWVDPLPLCLKNVYICNALMDVISLPRESKGLWTNASPGFECQFIQSQGLSSSLPSTTRMSAHLFFHALVSPSTDVEALSKAGTNELASPFSSVSRWLFSLLPPYAALGSSALSEELSCLLRRHSCAFCIILK